MQQSPSRVYFPRRRREDSLGRVERPRALPPGSRVAVIAPSFAAPTVFPAEYRAGLAVMREQFGWEPVEFASTTWSPAVSETRPRQKAEEIVEAFRRDDVDGVVTAFGGLDSVRLLPHLDIAAITAHPKVFSGYSDNSTQLLPLAAAGMIVHHGPTVVAGFAEAARHPGLVAHIRRMLCTTGGPIELLSPAALPSAGPVRWLGAPRAAEGPLLGGGAEVLDMMKATPWWPAPEAFDGRILVVESSAEPPSEEYLVRWFRGAGAQGVLGRIAGLVVGRHRGVDEAGRRRLDEAIAAVLREWGADGIPILAGAPVGHTDPQWVLPWNVPVRLDPIAGRVTLAHNGLRPPRP